MSLTETEREQVTTGIAAYHYEQKVLCRVIRKHGGRLTDDEFDRIFRLVRTKDGKKVIVMKRSFRAFRFFSADSFILGGLSSSNWAKWLELLQMMSFLGIVDTHKENDHIVYKLTSEGYKL